MLAVGGLLVWAGWSVSLWGWCLLRGYNVTLGQLMSPTHPYLSGKGQSWPPPLMPSDVIFPGGRTAAGAGSAASTPPGKPPRKEGRGAPVGFTGSTVKPFG